MEAAQIIRGAVSRVAELRDAQAARAPLGDAVVAIKALQSRRFSGTYDDLLRGGPYAAASRFFLEELYSARDFTARDAQFARIAGAIERLFPAVVAQTAVHLAQLHALTESLDHAMGAAWLGTNAQLTESARYVAAWQHVARREDRQMQLADVLAIGGEMALFTRTPGLRTMLRMMRAPAAAAGLAALQKFLETGFDTFAGIARADGARDFLRIIREREGAFIALLSDGPPAASAGQLAQTLGQAR